MAVMGPVGPEHCTRVPPRRAVTVAMSPAEIIPAKAPRPDNSPKAAPRLKATKLTVSPAMIFSTRVRLSGRVKDDMGRRILIVGG